MKLNQRKLMLCILFGVLFCIPFIRVSAEKVWEENFEIGPYDDWTLAGYKVQSGLVNTTNNSPSIENGRLNLLGTSYPYGLAAYHNSTVAYGTWSFDWIVPSSLLQDEVGIGYFFAGNFPIYLNGSELESNTLNSYLLNIESIFKPLDEACFNITIGEYNYGDWNLIEEYSFPDPVTGVIHIDITRDTDGTFRVYTDASNKSIMTIENNRIKTSERACFWTWYGESAIDNVVVHNSVEKTDPGPTPAFTFEVLLLIIPLSIIYTRKRRR